VDRPYTVRRPSAKLPPPARRAARPPAKVATDQKPRAVSSIAISLLYGLTATAAS